MVLGLAALSDDAEAVVGEGAEAVSTLAPLTQAVLPGRS